ncbi:gag-Pol polyprotein [Trichonephila clavipes]|nr:gag-Pol polyprotein [Trichonephila clavipes]
MPKRDGPYLILTQKSPTSYVIASLANSSEPIATYHTSALTPVKDINTSPVAPLRKRPTTKSYIHITKINMFQARRLLQQQFPTEPSIPLKQELLLQQLIMSPRRDVVGSIGRL